MAEKRMTQTQAIINHLLKFGSITSMEAFEKYGATRLSAIIFTLRQRGYMIINKDHECKNRFGGNVTYVEYKLIKAPNI